MVQKLKWEVTCPTGTSIFPNRVGTPLTHDWQLHGHDFYECFIVEEGTAQHLLKAKATQTLETGVLHFVHPSLCHGFKTAKNGSLTMTNVAIKASVVERFRAYHPYEAEVWNAGLPLATVSVSQRRIQAFLRLAHEVAISGREELDAIYFLSGLARLIRPAHDEPTATVMPDWLRHAISQCTDPEHLRLGVTGLVNLCSRSPEHVSRCFRKHLQQTPIQWITTARLDYARRLLESTQLQILEIAMECGFENPSHFHKLFKTHFGDTPLQFRKKSLRIQMG